MRLFTMSRAVAVGSTVAMFQEFKQISENFTLKTMAPVDRACDISIDSRASECRAKWTAAFLGILFGHRVVGHAEHVFAERGVGVDVLDAHVDAYLNIIS